MQETNKEIKVKQYINNYLIELQRHFDMPDKKMRQILYRVYKDKGNLSKSIRFIKKYISMVKSFYIRKLRKIR